MEKDCKWYFDKSGISVTGPNDSIHETFRANPYYSIVRESIQNSLDAVHDESKPVKVLFEFSSLQKKLFPNLFSIKEHIIACTKFHKGDTQAEKLYLPMAKYIDSNEEIKFLKVSDYNTKGMSYDSEDVNCPFTSFVRAEGKSAKDNGAGGSFGFGKGAYYVLSNIKALLVSTMTVEKKFFFEGKTRLATHKLDEGLFTRDGYYNKSYETPVERLSDIPELFIRKEPGTDIYIIGMLENEGRKQEMVKSVLNNFWFAIFYENLEVEIREGADLTIINKKSLEKIIDLHFPSFHESGSTTDILGWNPKAYFKAVKYSGSNSEQYKLIEKSLPTLGDVRLYVYMDKGLPNRVAYFRKPKMVIQKKTKNKINGFVAVFVCDNKNGNELLRKMENAAHNEWKIEHNRVDEPDVKRELKDAYNELNDFVNRALEDLSKVDISKRTTFLGLEEYLSIGEDLLEKAETDGMLGNNSSEILGRQSNDETMDETGMQTTYIFEPPSKIKPTIKIQSKIKEDATVEASEEGNEKITTGGQNDTDGGIVFPNDFGDTLKNGTKDNDVSQSKVLVKVNLKVAAQLVGNELFHILIINSTNPIAKAELEIFVGADNDKEDGVGIVYSNKGTLSNNSIKNVSIEAGRNQIKIRFADMVKHSIKIKTYEIQ